MDLIEKKEAEDTLRVWAGPAQELVLEGKSKYSIIAFLQEKGVPREMAAEAADGIYQKGKDEQARRRRPHQIIAWVTIILGVLFLGMGWVEGYIFGIGFTMIGAGIYWLQTHSK